MRGAHFLLNGTFWVVPAVPRGFPETGRWRGWARVRNRPSRVY